MYESLRESTKRPIPPYARKAGLALRGFAGPTAESAEIDNLHFEKINESCAICSIL